jgi:acyl-CoA thioester hydrolase
MGNEFTHALRVRWSECDPQGIVFNANYLMYFDVVFNEMWHEAIGPWSEITARGVDTVLAETKLTFRGSARFEDDLELRARVDHLGTTSVITGVTIVRGEEVIVEGTLRHVLVSTSDWRKTELPPWICDGLGRFRA